MPIPDRELRRLEALKAKVIVLDQDSLDALCELTAIYESELARKDAALRDEREACARIASAQPSSLGDCEQRGPMDMETGTVECNLENKHGFCICAGILEHGAAIAARIRKRSALTPATET